MASHFFFVRHGESVSNGLNRIQGHSDSGLTAQGRRQAKKLSKKLKDFKIKKIYSSDLGRAMTTAGILAKGLKKRIHSDHLWREIRLGEWEGMSTDEVNGKYNQGYAKWLASPSKMKIPGAETVHEFHKRVRGRVDRLFEEEQKSPVVIVTHGGVIASLISHWLDADFDKTLLNLRVDNTSVTWVEKNDSRIKIHKLNDISHLSANDITKKNIYTNR